MKELSVEEKAKRYDEALIRGSRLWESDMITRESYEYIFPEVKESENIKIIKAIKYGLDHVFTNNTTVFEVTKEQCLSWLEVQGEHANFRNKIQIGDKVTRNEDGVLVNLSQLNRVAKKQGEQKPIISNDALREGIAHFGITQYQIDNWLKKYVDVEKQGEQKSTKWSEDDETSIAINNPDAYRIGFADGEAHAKEEMTTAWSEDDELLIRELESLVKQVWAIAEHENDKETIHKMSDLSFFLKTLKPQLKQEWGEEDESKRKFIEDELSCLIADEREIESPLTKRAKDLYSALYWFKSIKDRYTWKPSDEQIEYLAKAITTLGYEGDCKTASILNDLRVELKKLREE